MSYRQKSFDGPAAIKDVDGKKGIITGYFAAFNNEDSDGDTILPGAFTKTIAERGPNSSQPRVKFLRNHLVYEPIGNITLLQEDAKGLYYEAVAGSHIIGKDTVAMIESGLITEHSFGFETIRKNVKNPDADWFEQKRELLELKLWEGSALTAWGANERTGAATLKSLGKEVYVKQLKDRAARVEKFCNNSNASDETIELLLLEHKQLIKMVLDTINEKSTTPEPERSTLPDEIGQTLDNFIKSLKN